VIVLASASSARRALLEAAGVPFTVDVAAIDEAGLRQSLRRETANPARPAELLAELKAMRVSARHPGALVIGADQVLDYDGRWFDKPADLTEARAQLLTLRHHTHRLTSSVVAVRDGRKLWYHTEQALMTLRNFSEEFLDHYLASVGEAALAAVGAYHLEGLGAQLFLKVDGDFFTVLGLPLLPLLDFLRENEELKR